MDLLNWMGRRNRKIVSTHNRVAGRGLDYPLHTGMPLIDRFQREPEIFIFLISTLAGGTGLNLTAANKVVVFG
jgi:hypothetical protein